MCDMVEVEDKLKHRDLVDASVATTRNLNIVGQKKGCLSAMG